MLLLAVPSGIQAIVEQLRYVALITFKLLFIVDIDILEMALRVSFSKVAQDLSLLELMDTKALPIIK
jgi:predicted transcriptional regulator